MILRRLHSRNTVLNLQKAYLAAFLISVGAMLQGCPIFPSYGHPDIAAPQLTQVDGKADTFRMVVPSVFRNQEDYVKAVRVTDWREAYKGNLVVYWEVRAKERVSMHGFEVEVGRVPEGFEQTIPAAGTKFTPELGKLYYISVSLENYPGWEWITSSYTGGQLKSNEDWRSMLESRTNNGKH